MVCIGRNVHRRSHIAMHAGKRLRNQERVPAFQSPGPFWSYIKGKNRRAGYPSQMDWSGFSYIAWAARTIDGKGHKFARLQFALQLAQRLYSSARVGSANRAKPQSLDDSGDVLAVIAAAGEHAYLMIAEHIGGGEDAAVPKAVNCRTRLGLTFRPGFIREGKPQRRAD